MISIKPIWSCKTKGEEEYNFASEIRRISTLFEYQICFLRNYYLSERLKSLGILRSCYITLIKAFLKGKITCRWTFLLLWKVLSRFLFICFPSEWKLLLGQKSKYLLEELPVNCNRLKTTFLIKLTASLPVPVSFRCNPPRFRPVILIFELWTMSNCGAESHSFTLFTVSVTFSSSVLLTTFWDIRTFEWGNVQ